MTNESNKRLHLYATPESPCSYLDGQISQSVFLDPNITITNHHYHQLNRLGFRRSGSHIYKPWCKYCHACKSVRIIVNDFVLSKNQRRVFKRNSDLCVVWKSVGTDDEYLDLYTRYINQRHVNSDMYPPSKEQFAGFLGTEITGINAYFLCFYKDSDLLAVSVVDVLDDGVSALYTFYDPSMPARSLGKLAILWLTKWLQRHQFKYLYLGFWVKNSPKMDYKINYQPLEFFDGSAWQLLTNQIAKSL